MQRARNLRLRGDATQEPPVAITLRVFCDACPCRVYMNEQNSEAGGVQQ
jgi:hypothetical protein